MASRSGLVRLFQVFLTSGILITFLTLMRSMNPPSCNSVEDLRRTSVREKFRVAKREWDASEKLRKSAAALLSRKAIDSDIIFYMPQRTHQAPPAGRSIPWGPGSGELYDYVRSRAQASYRLVFDSSDGQLRREVLPRCVGYLKGEDGDEVVRQHVTEIKEVVNDLRKSIEELGLQFAAPHNHKRSGLHDAKLEIIDLSLIVSLNTSRLEDAWLSLESLRLQTVWPKELIIMASNLERSRRVEFLSFLEVFVKVYAIALPSDVHVTLYTTSDKFSRSMEHYAGLLRSSSDLVGLFTADEFLHPSAFQISSTFMAIDREIDQLMFRHTTVEYHNGPKRGGVPRYIHTFLKDNAISDKVVKTVTFANHSNYFQHIRDSLPRKAPSEHSWYYGNWKAELAVPWFIPSCSRNFIVTRRRVFDFMQPRRKATGTGWLLAQDTMCCV